MKTLTVPEQHQHRIAQQTLRLSDVGASVLGGMTKDEARQFLRRIGYTDAMIAKLES